ncbi:deoxynucleoside triphosphate triphosphohydrolase SAMHD1 homolog isoform X2 [Sesamum indicum]|uniref:Deoxynucleoside triphosphate triphosphohydrolase SAMHD1 homolog isoform X2 n=1 Tax=Sesamum indicum TaxID=4182 RepID=A0A6I9TYI9_SESIN|nr:deoxynucleoside triphosphate triphosphohydrolase SAMHD1 homolog isoform X2 [Sesamum indicum]
MGATYCDEELPSKNFALASTDDRRFTKHIHDNVHGNIYIDPLSLKFVDTEQFQRLRDLKQLGFSYMVYPGAVHSRFEHSLGVYWLASEAINRLKTYQGLELDIDHFDTQTVKLAGLLHDLGHGPFSHTFEREFLPRVCNGQKWSHEEMSLKMIDHVVDEHNIDIDSESLKRVKEMIIASENGTSKSFKEKLFLYDIVANGRNGIDVDKFDYIVRDSRACGLGCNFQFQRVLETMRVIDDEICYRAKEYLTIQKLFAARADLHRMVYMHAKVKAIEMMFVDAMTKANDVLCISSYIDEPAEYWKLDDTILKAIETSSSQDLKESRDLILRIRRRELYQFCNEFAVPKDKLEYFKNVTPQDIVCSQNSSHPILHEEDIVVSNVKIDLTRGRNNPLESISFFKDYESNEKFNIKDDLVSHLLPTSYQDMIVRVYSKKPHLVEAVSEAFENFQLKIYGKKAQVHATPEKKKRKRLRHICGGGV